MVRHGQRADFCAKQEFSNKQDPRLTPHGLEEAKLTGEFVRKYLDDIKPDKVIIECSPFMRAMTTAAQLAKEIGIYNIGVNYMFTEFLSEQIYPTDPIPHLEYKNRTSKLSYLLLEKA